MHTCLNWTNPAKERREEKINYICMSKNKLTKLPTLSFRSVMSSSSSSLYAKEKSLEHVFVTDDPPFLAWFGHEYMRQWQNDLSMFYEICACWCSTIRSSNFTPLSQLYTSMDKESVYHYIWNSTTMENIWSYLWFEYGCDTVLGTVFIEYSNIKHRSNISIDSRNIGWKWSISNCIQSFTMARTISTRYDYLRIRR